MALDFSKLRAQLNWHVWGRNAQNRKSACSSIQHNATFLLLMFYKCSVRFYHITEAGVMTVIRNFKLTAGQESREMVILGKKGTGKYIGIESFYYRGICK